MPTVRDAPWQSQLTPKPAHCPHAACRFSSARRGCSTCGRLLVEQRRGPTSMVTQVLATVSAPVLRPLRFGGQALRRVWSPSGRMPLAARHCAGRHVAGAGRVVKPARRAGKGWAFLARTSLSAARSCAVHSTKAVLARSRPRTQRDASSGAGCRRGTFRRRLLHRNSIHREKYIATASTPPPAPRRPRGKNCMNLERKRAPLQRRVEARGAGNVPDREWKPIGMYIAYKKHD